VQCLRTGVREVSATPSRPGTGRRGVVARLAPLELPASAQVRLRRLHPEAVYKEEPRQVQVTLGAGDVATQLAELLRQLVPPAEVAPDAASPSDAALSRR